MNLKGKKIKKACAKNDIGQLTLNTWGKWNYSIKQLWKYAIWNVDSN